MDRIESQSFDELQVDDSASLGTLTYKDVQIFCDHVPRHKPVSIVVALRHQTGLFRSVLIDEAANSAHRPWELALDHRLGAADGPVPGGGSSSGSISLTICRRRSESTISMLPRPLGPSSTAISRGL